MMNRKGTLSKIGIENFLSLIEYLQKPTSNIILDDKVKVSAMARNK